MEELDKHLYVPIPSRDWRLVLRAFANECFYREEFTMSQGGEQN